MLPLLLATVVRLVDGDTLHVRDGGAAVKVRLLGVACAELSRNAKCFKLGAEACEREAAAGKAARKRVKQLMPLRSQVTIEAHGHDRAGRTLAYVTLPDGRDLGLQLIREGVCADASDRWNHPREDAYRDAAKP